MEQSTFEQYKTAPREQATVITLDNGAKIGGGHFLVMAGPCSVESEEQLMTAAQVVKAAGAQVLRFRSAYDVALYYAIVYTCEALIKYF